MGTEVPTTFSCGLRQPEIALLWHRGKYLFLARCLSLCVTVRSQPEELDQKQNLRVQQGAFTAAPTGDKFDRRLDCLTHILHITQHWSAKAHAEF